MKLLKTIALSAVLFTLILAGLVVAADNLPDPVEPVVHGALLTCEGVDGDCSVYRFEYGGDRKVYCQVITGFDGRPRPGRCIVDPPRNEVGR